MGRPRAALAGAWHERGAHARAAPAAVLHHMPGFLSSKTKKQGGFRDVVHGGVQDPGAPTSRCGLCTCAGRPASSQRRRNAPEENNRAGSGSLKGG